MNQNAAGFTLIEVSLVLLIVTILLGYSLGVYPVQQELKQYRAAQTEMDSIIQRLLYFAEINGRLPCPDTSTGGTVNGQEDLNGPGKCRSIYAYLPGRDLGMQGNYDSNNRLLDPWGQPYRYGVSSSTSNAADNFVDRNQIRAQGVDGMNGDIFICDDSNTTGANANCSTVSGNEVMSRVAAIVVSTGKDRGRTPTSNIQAENQDNFNNSSTADHVYIYAQRSDASGAEYDDLVKWLPTNLLLSKLIEAGQLP